MCGATGQWSCDGATVASTGSTVGCCGAAPSTQPARVRARALHTGLNACAIINMLRRACSCSCPAVPRRSAAGARPPPAHRELTVSLPFPSDHLPCPSGMQPHIRWLPYTTSSSGSGCREGVRCAAASPPPATAAAAAAVSAGGRGARVSGRQGSCTISSAVGKRSISSTLSSCRQTRREERRGLVCGAGSPSWRRTKQGRQVGQDLVPSRRCQRPCPSPPSARPTTHPVEVSQEAVPVDDQARPKPADIPAGTQAGATHGHGRLN